MNTTENKRIYRAPRGTELNTKGWVQEAALRMLMNNLDPEVAEWPEKLVVYGGIGKAARNWESFDAIVETLKNLEEGFPEPDLLRIRLTSILAHLRRFMQTFHLERIHHLEIRYKEIFQTILHVPVLFRVVQEVLLFIYDIIQEANNQNENAHGDFIERGLRYIDDHFHRADLSLEEVANYVQRSPSYFSHILSSTRAQTFSQYVTDVRMKQAKHLLFTTSLTVREIAFVVGYDDPNYFSRLFKENTQYSPRAWRLQKGPK